METVSNPETNKTKRNLIAHQVGKRQATSPSRQAKSTGQPEIFHEYTAGRH